MKRDIYGRDIHMEEYTQRDIHTKRHIRWYINMIEYIYKGDIRIEKYIQK